MSNTGGSPSGVDVRAGHDFSRLADPTLGTCPPAVAQPTTGEFFAFHDTETPSASDFRTAAQTGAFEDKDPCQRHSNSIWSDLPALQTKIQKLKKRHPLRYDYVSQGSIKPEHGLIMPSGPPHHSFWVCGKWTMHLIFTKRVV